MPLTFKSTGIVLIFWDESFFASQALCTRVISHPMSRHIESSGSVRDDKAAKSKMIKVVS